VNAELLDRYLLGEPVSKAAVVAELLAAREVPPAAVPFRRALEALGPLVAEEALVALRLTLAGIEPDDDDVRRIRALVAIARAAAVGDLRGALAAFVRDGEALADFPDPARTDLAELGTLARAGYREELATDETIERGADVP